MARPRKEGFEYFSHDTSSMSDEKLDLLVTLYGANGYAFFFAHLEYIYMSEDLSVDVGGPVIRKLLCSKFKITPDEYDEILNTSLEIGLFDAEHFKETGKLISNGVMKRVKAIRNEREENRKRQQRFQEKRQNNGEITEQDEVITDYNAVITEPNELSRGITPKGKGKGKGKEYIADANESACAERLPDGNPSSPPEPPPEPYGIDIPLVDGTSYAVTKADVTQWQDAYPGVNVPQELREIRSWSDSNQPKRKTRKGVRRFINSWLAREQDKVGRNDRASPNISTPVPMTPRQRYMRERVESIRAFREEIRHACQPDIIDVTPADPAPAQLAAAERRIEAPVPALPAGGP